MRRDDRCDKWRNRVERKRTCMRRGIHPTLAPGKTWRALLLMVVMVAMIPLGGDVAISQSTPGAITHPPMFTAIDLHPSGFTYSQAVAISGDQQVGWGAGPATGGSNHALLWKGSAASVVDLQPSGFTSSEALGISGSYQVGHGSGPATGGLTHALLWSGSSANVVDLHPKEFTESHALGISGSQQVGYGGLGGPSDPGHRNDSGPFHALLWRGSAASVVDLHPGGYASSSQALGISGDRQVGWGSITVPGGYDHALMWLGRADRIVDLNPSELSESRAVGISGGQQVGYGRVRSIGPPPTYVLLWRGSSGSVVEPGVARVLATNGTEQVGDDEEWNGLSRPHHAMLWSGGTVVDLHTFLPPGFTSSTATGIDSNGDIVGYADGHAILWKRNVGARPLPALPVDTSGGSQVHSMARALLISGDNMTFVLTDPQGRRTGEDPVHHVSYREIPGAGYRNEFYDMASETDLQLLDQAAGEYALDVFGSGDFQVHVSTWGVSGQWLTRSFQGQAAAGASARFTFPGDVIPFAGFQATLKIYTPSDAFAVNGTFTPGQGEKISPTTEDVTIEVGGHLLATIPSGSFKQIGSVSVFKGVIKGVALKVTLTRTGAHSFAFTIEGSNAAKIEGGKAAMPWPWFEETRAPNPDTPVKLNMAIGGNSGSISVKAEYAR